MPSPTTKISDLSDAEILRHLILPDGHFRRTMPRVVVNQLLALPATRAGEAITAVRAYFGGNDGAKTQDQTPAG